MHALGQHASGSTDRTHLIEAAAINALAVFDDLGAHHRFGQRLEAVAQQLAVAAHSGAHRIGLFEGGDGLSSLGLNRIELAIALGFGERELGEHCTDVFGALLGQVVGNGGVFLGLFGHHLLDAQLSDRFFLVADQLEDRFVAEVDRLDHVLFRQLLGAGFHHHHTFGGAGHHQIKLGALDLAVAGVEDEVVAQQADAHGGHRSVEGDLG